MMSPMDTPTTPEGLARYDHLPPLDAILQAWNEPGPRPDWHRRAQDEVRRAMPLLARALDRLVEREQALPGQRRPQRRYGLPWQTGEQR